MTRRTLSALTDIALRIMIALSFVAVAWSVSEIAKTHARTPIPALRRIEPISPCAPDRAGVKRFASLEGLAS